MTAPSLGNRNVCKKISLLWVVPLLLLGTSEAILRLIDFSHSPRSMMLRVPHIVLQRGGDIETISTTLTPPGYLWKIESNTSITDSFGFRIQPPSSASHQANTKIFTIAFLGGSTTQGGTHAFSDTTTESLNQTFGGGTTFQALNVACAHYTTHQSVLAFHRWVMPLQPNLVVVYHGWNDMCSQVDGYSDHEKDSVPQKHSFSQVTTRLAAWKIPLAANYVRQQLDRSWPRPRVPPERFQQNYNRIIHDCQKANIPVVIFMRPWWGTEELPNLGLGSMIYFSRRYDTLELRQLSQAAYTEYTKIQLRMADPSKGVYVFDAARVVEGMIHASHNTSPPQVGIFEADGVHLTSMADQILGEALAEFILETVLENTIL